MNWRYSANDADENLERVLGQLLDVMPSILIGVDGAGRIIVWNRAAEALFKLSATEVLGMTLAECPVAWERAKLVQAAEDCQRSGQTRRLENVRFRCPDSTEGERLLGVTLTPVNTTPTPLGSSPCGFLMLAADITERKRMEEALLIRDRAIQSSNNGIIIADARLPDIPVVYLNPAFEAITGYPAGEILGKNCRFLQRDDTDQAGLSVLRTALKRGTNCRVVLRNYRKDGTMFINALGISPVHDVDGTLTHFIGIQTNITERTIAEERLRKMTERALQVSEERLKTVVTSAPIVLFALDRSGVFTLSEGKMLESMGLKPGEATGRSVFDMFPDLPSLKNSIGRVLAGQAVTEVIEIAGMAFETRLQPQRDMNGRIIGVIGISTDITERRMLESQLVHAQKMESIGHLAAGIAHEINTPTQYISDNLAFLQEAFADLHHDAGPQNDPATEDDAEKEYLLTEIPRALEQSRQGIQHVAGIVQAMKEFSHPGSGTKIAIDLNKTIESTIVISSNEWKYVADLETALDPSLPPVICLPGEFNQVILNLIVNAAHAISDALPARGEEKGKITIQTRRWISDDSWVEILLTDTGTGIPESARAKIFDPFFTTKEVGRGTGQGLSIAHSIIVDKHGGTIGFETEMGKGTTFVIRLPFTPTTSNASTKRGSE